MNNANQYELSPIKNMDSLSQSIMVPSMSRTILKRQHEIQQSKMYHKMALDSFPFGKEGVKLAQSISAKINSKQQQENARILEEFRKKAIEDKFHNRNGIFRNSKVMNRYITESMMPGVTVNPTMVKSCLEPQLKYEQYKHQNYDQSNLYLSQGPTRQYTQPVYNTIDPQQQVYDTRRKGSLPFEQHYNHQHTISQNQNYPSYPQKLTTSQSQTQIPNLKSYNELDLQRKYYKLKCKYSKKAMNNFDKVERMLYSLNKQIQKNSRYLQKVLYENHNSISVLPKKRGKLFRNVQSSLHEQSKKNFKSKARTELKEDFDSQYDEHENQSSTDWNRNHKILYNSTQQSFCDQRSVGNNKKRPKPTICYTSSCSPTKNTKNIQNFFTPNISKKKSRLSNFEESSQYNKLMKQKKQKKHHLAGIEKIRQHLKLLKKNANRLDIINDQKLEH